MAITELKTRIALKYDTYTNWTSDSGKSLVLLKGEVGICEIPSGSSQATTAPTILFKVGDGQKTFEELSWISAKAADVYSWAKVENAEDILLEVEVGTTESPKTLKITLANWLVNYYTHINEVSNKFKTIDSNISTINANIASLNTSTPPSGDFVTSVVQTEGKVTITKGNVTSDVVKMPAFNSESTQATSTLKSWVTECENKLSTLQTAVDNQVTLNDVSNTVTNSLATLSLEEPATSNSTALAFVDTIEQTNGKVTATKKKLPTASTSAPGIVQLDTTSGAASYSTVNSLASRVNDTETDIADLKVAVTGGVHFIGEVTNPSNLATQLQTQTVTINSKSYLATPGDVVIQNEKEFIWVGSSWKELGDLSRVGTLETKIANLDYSDTNAAASKFVTKVTQTDGQIAVTHAQPSSEDITHSTSTVKTVLDDQTNRLSSLETKLVGVNTVQSAITDALGALDVANSVNITGTSTYFVSEVTQNNGKISFKHAGVPSGTASTPGMVKLGNSGGAAKFEEVETIKESLTNDHAPRITDIESDYIRYNQTDQKLYIGKDADFTMILDCGGPSDL